MQYLKEFIKSFVEGITDDWVNDKMLGTEKEFADKRNYFILLVVFAFLSALCHVAEMIFHLNFSLFFVFLAVSITAIVVGCLVTYKTLKERINIILYAAGLLGIAIVGWLLLKMIEFI